MKNSIFLILAFGLISCGGGEFEIDRNAATASNVVGGNTGSGSSGLTPQEFFTQKLYPIMKSTDAKGCGATAACHNPNLSPNSTADTFFKVDPNSAVTSYNWAGPRRKTPITLGTYASGTAVTIKSKKDSAHNSFTSWTDAEKALIDSWTSLTE